jgi:hypothetical protein
MFLGARQARGGCWSCGRWTWERKGAGDEGRENSPKSNYNGEKTKMTPLSARLAQVEVDSIWNIWQLLAAGSLHRAQRAARPNTLSST